jgi:Fe-S-cluster containining protein
MDAPLPLDTTLLDGLSFACRPDCGLCCFASPRVEPAEAAAIRAARPDLSLVEIGRDRFLAARPDGGACALLADLRCTLHDRRPGPCREFPVTVHVGERLQATAVLSCPGLRWTEALVGRPVAPPASGAFGLEAELAAVRRRIGPPVRRRLEAAARRRRRIVRSLEDDGRWEDEDDVRAALGRDLPMPRDGAFWPEDPPPESDGLVSLPLFFDRRAGPVAIAAGVGGWKLLELSAEGGVRAELGTYPAPDRVPELEPAGRDLLRGYLAHWLARDAFFGYAVLVAERSGSGSLREVAARELRAIGATALARALLRARARRSGPYRLSAEDVADGIRATDQDLLDRPTWGDRL